MATTIVGVVLGAVIAILFTMVIENLRKPHLAIKMIPPTDKEYENRPTRNARFLVCKYFKRAITKMGQLVDVQKYGNTMPWHYNVSSP